MKTINHIFISVLSVYSLSAAACVAGSDTELGTDSQRGDLLEPRFVSCMDGALPQGLPTVSWTHFGNRLVTLGGPWHAAQDILVATGQPAVLAAKFSYGSLSKDLEGERIQVWIDDCAGGYRLLGEQVTNGDGRISLTLRPGEVPPAGEYGVYFRVRGDDSGVSAALRIYPRNTQFIVFDIDATLTTSDSELFGQVLSDIVGGECVPEAREGAADLVSLRHDEQDYEVIYLTGRPYLLTEVTRTWLADLGFPSGTVRVTDSVTASWPSDSAVGNYKASYLRNIVLGQGFSIYAAYGNATTDIYAYEQAGVNKARMYIMGSHGGERGSVAVGEVYMDHTDAVAGESPADQPFFE